MNFNSATRLYIHEVALRDGLQIEPRFVPTADKIALIDGLSRSGIRKIEATSFTSPKAIPALADAEAVLAGIERVAGVEYAALVPNALGAARALNAGVDEMNVVVSISRTHNLANLRMTPEQSLVNFAEIARMAEGQRSVVNASLSTAFGCPFEGDISLARVLEMVQRVHDLGIARITLCDTTGVANPTQVAAVCDAVLQSWPGLVFTAHFHDTRGMGLANALAALQSGIVRFDASLGGLGGCPFAPGASGNVCTEDLVHMLQAMGYDTGVDLAELTRLAGTLPGLVGHDVPGTVLKAGPSNRRHRVPEGLGERGTQQRLAGIDPARSVQANA